MKPIYEDSHDVHIRSNLVYAKAADKKLYYEAVYTNQVTQADLEDAFKKGTLLIVDGDTYLKAFELSGNIVKTICRTGIGSDAFDSTETYDVGDRVVHDSVVYECTTQISVAAAWDATKWIAVDTTDYIEWAAEAAE